MDIRLMIPTGGVPAGSYMARFVGIEAWSDDYYGDAVRWQFEVLSDPHKGAKISRFTSANPTLTNSCGKILAGIIGKPLTPGEGIDANAYTGKNYLIAVVDTEFGGTRVDSVSPPPVG
jgi:hypothetical protein